MKKIFTCIVLFVVIVGTARAQSEYQPYSYDFYQKLDADAYSTSTREHTSMKPYFVDDSILKSSYDSLMNYGNDGTKHGLVYRKIFNEHLIDLANNKSTFYADLLPDFTAGKNLSGGKEYTGLVSYGAQVGGTMSDKFYYNASYYASQGNFPEYISTYIMQTGVIPGEAYAKIYGQDSYDWQYFTADLSYTPIKFLNITAGKDKTFIGDGYRSLMLSDNSAPAPFFKLTATLGNVKYMAMWAHYTDPQDLDLDGNKSGKWAVFHYLDWNVTNKFSLGFFDSIIWYNKDDEGHSRGFDVTYVNPVIFLRPLEASNGSPDNALIGFTSKYKITNGITAYGQFFLDEFQAKQFFTDNGSSRNKYGYQLGIRGANMFGVKGLNYLLETNNVKPYTYSERGPILSFTGNGEPLAQPWGANFREAVGLLNYSYKRFDFSGEGDYGHYGLDINGLDYGKDPFQDYIDPAKLENNYIGQGLTTNMYYVKGKVAYILNPKYNLRLEVSALYRDEKNVQFDDKTTLLTIGIRSSFRQVYDDLASYKTH
jgi:hypothetical protein